MTFYITLSLCAFLISLIGTRLTILALRKKPMLLDIPTLRSNHKQPTPRGGGIAVVMALIICLLVDDVHYAIILSVLLLAAISLLDDLISVPPWIRFIVQIIAVAIALCLFRTPFFSFLPPMLDKFIIGLLWVWFINLFNFMDGIDGITAVETGSIGLGFCLLAAIEGTFPNPIFTYGLIITCAACGFIWWNWHPARIFLGDVGSIPLGFIVGYLLLMAAHSGYVFPALILPAYYIADGGITLAKRIWQKKKIWQAHSEHYYQQAVRRRHTHDMVARRICGINLLLVLLATLSMLYPDLAGLYLAIAYFAVFMLLGFFAHGEPDKHHI